MTALPMPYWEAVRLAAEPFELMKFTLIYDGDLPAGDGKRAIYASKIRNEIHDQLADLWDSHVILRQLDRTARIWASQGTGNIVHLQGVDWFRAEKLPDFREPVPPVADGTIDLCRAIEANGIQGAKFKPLIRESLNLACAVDILFLRHEEPFALFEQGGDLDNRIKTFFDGLKIPDKNQFESGEHPRGDPLYVLLQDDLYVSDFSIRTARLLGARTKEKHAVRIVAEVTIKVLRVTDENQCLIGG